MTARAHVAGNFLSQGVDVWLGRVADDAGGLRTLLRADVTMITAVEAVQAEPSLRLPDDIAVALMNALVEHYGGTSAMQTLRKDYEHERGRVDALITYLVDTSKLLQLGRDNRL